MTSNFASRISMIFAFTLWFVACAHRPKLVEISSIDNFAGPRSPASVESLDSDDNEADLQSILQSNTAASDLLEHVDNLVHLHERAQLELGRFDRALDASVSEKRNTTPVTDRTNKTYSRLVTLMMMTHKQCEKVSYIFARLLDISVDGKESEKATATQTMGELKRKMRHLTQAERVFLQDLLRNLSALQHEFSITNPSKNSTDLADASFDDALFATTDELTTYFDQNQAAINAAVSDVSSKDDPQVEMMSNNMHSLLNMSGLRAPQSSGIQPSVGPQGNLTGREFPAGAWAFTFDDGPSSVYTPGILDNLDRNGIKATFFWLAQNTSRPANHSSMARAFGDGQQPQCHSYTHANLAKAGAALIKHEVTQALAEERSEYSALKKDYVIKFYRCPYGSCLRNQAVRQALVNENMIHAFWNVDTLDWQDHNPSSIVARAQKQMAVQKHGIILFHDIHPQSVTASGMLMKIVKSDSSLRTVTLPQMIQELNH